jgi:DNA adenine methylase
MDPPCWGTEGYGVEFGLEEYGHIANKLRAIKGKAIVSVNDIPEMHKVFKGMIKAEVGIKYSVSGGGKATSTRCELIIINFI